MQDPEATQAGTWFSVDPAWNAPRLADELLAWAGTRGATDLHLSPHPDGFTARVRVDGDLQDVVDLDEALFHRLVARLKIVAELDPAERRRPQDGRFEIGLGDRRIDVRLSVLPAMQGEAMVLRLLDRTAGLKSMDELGLERKEIAQLRALLSHRSGMVIVTGPSGAGKTTTLYAALRELSGPDRNVVTIEDPVEYEIPRAVQTSVRPEIGVTFASLLRSVMRHDPDVILVGEIRDAETARVAVGAALSGHLVLTSLHTQRAADALVALQQYGVEPYALAPALRGVVAQQLVRTICPACRTTFEYGDQLLGNPDVAAAVKTGETPSFSIGLGCEACMGKGYRGRRGIFELLEVDEELRERLYAGARADALEEAALAGGMVPLPRKGYRAVVEGVTTVEEVVRALALD